MYVVCHGVRVSPRSEVEDSVDYLVACCDRQPLIWRRCAGASRDVFCPGTSQRWTLCRWAGSCKDSPRRRTVLNMSEKHTVEINIKLLLRGEVAFLFRNLLSFKTQVMIDWYCCCWLVLTDNYKRSTLSINYSLAKKDIKLGPDLLFTFTTQQYSPLQFITARA